MMVYVSSPKTNNSNPIINIAATLPASLKKKTVPIISFLSFGRLTISRVVIDSKPRVLREANSQKKLNT